ncbi:hypothetical protein G9464_08070 [Halostella sp. JP-L12]|uniref:hypothetical protein n=1 Tax=Halostella TaxID=1843185 RepID=UPI000EF7EBE0|nr:MULTISPECIES: hypothetical protein [Halostella]NHN47551.1 hypothetical protein [Halostella sp. JP-L12]
MVTRRALATLAVALALVFAGCAADGAAFRTTQPGNATNETATTERPTTTAVEAADEYSVPVRGGELPVDPNRTFARVQALVGTDVRPRTVTVIDGSSRSSGAGYYAEREFFDIMGLEETDYATDGASGVTYADGQVQITTRNASDAEVERVLAHEFTHTVQMRSGMTADLDSVAYTRRTTDYAMTRQALVEGGAVYVTDAYAERFQDGTARQSSRVAAEYERGPAGNRYLWAPYYFGYEYVSDSVDSPDELSSVYEDHPETTEQLLHGRTPAAEPPAELELGAADTGDWYRTGADTKGELVTRIVLRSELSKGVSTAAAAGWGNDRVFVYEHASGDEAALAWALRWDSPDEADEAQAAFESYADRRADDADISFRVERVTPETVVVFAGAEAFVENASAAGKAGEVAVAVGDAAAAESAALPAPSSLAAPVGSATASPRSRPPVA